MKNSKRLYLAALIPFAVIVLLFELMPVAATVMRSFSAEGGGGFTLEHYSAIFTKKLYRTALINSLWVSVLSSVIGLAVAFWGAKAYKSANGGLRNIFLSVLNMTSNFSGIPLAFSYIILLGNVGVLVMLGKHHGIEALAGFNIYSIWGLLLCYIYFQIPLATLLLIPAFDGLKKEWREAVALLGGSETVYWLKVGLRIRHGLRAYAEQLRAAADKDNGTVRRRRRAAARVRLRARGRADAAHDGDDSYKRQNPQNEDEEGEVR